MKDVVKVYVSEYELEDLTIEGLEHSCSNNWNPQSISDMAEDMLSTVFEIPVKGSDEETVNVYLDFEDPDDLAEWCLANGLKEYDEKNTARESEYDMLYKGTKFKFIVLVEDILTDFLSDAVGNIKSITELPKGVSIYLE